MKDKLVIWGENATDERVLIALQLQADENVVDIWTFPDKLANEEFSKKMFNDWRNNKEVEFPEDHTHEQRKLTISDSILPDHLKVKQDDLLMRAQTQWHFVVVSNKMRKVLDQELDELEKNIHDLEDFSKDAWDNLKEFWSKVQRQVEEKLLYREHADEVRTKTDNLFKHMKDLRRKADEEFREQSKKNKEFFKTTFDKLDSEIEENFRFQPLFDELRKLQRKFNNSKLTREDRSKVWERLDGLFKTVKAKKFGEPTEGEGNTQFDRRLTGIERSIQRIEKSIQRDKRDLEQEKHRIETTDGQLEAQIRQAKIAMIEQRLHSKEKKLAEILSTQESIREKAEREEKRRAQEAEKQRVKEAEAAAKKKIAEQIQQKKLERKSEEGDLKKAAEAIQGEVHQPAQEQVVSSPTPSASEEPSLSQSIEDTLGDSFKDVVDTAKAVALVMGKRGGDFLQEVMEDLQEEIQETVGEIMGREEE